MNRRSFLRGLLTLPLAPLAAKFLPEAPASVKQVARVANIDTADLAPSGSDQTSIWQVEWFDLSGYILPDGPLPVRFADPPRNWLKESIRGN